MTIRPYYKAVDKKAAWDIVDLIMPCDSLRVEVCGEMEIYRDPQEYYNYVCDLGDRLEVNLKEGNRTVNVWF